MGKEVYIVDAARTALGKFMGSLKDVSAPDLSASVIKALLSRNKINPAEVSEVILGQVLLGGEGQNPARQAAVAAGIPYSVPEFVVEQVCGSGLRAVIEGAKSIALGESSIVLAGGQESMSTSRHGAHIREKKMGNIEMEDMMLLDGLTDAFHKYHMGITAENVAKKYKVTREMQDKFSQNSQTKASLAQKEGRFKAEIVPVHTKKGVFDADEYIRTDSTLAALSSLKPAFMKDGTVTAGNSSGINDGAAVLLMMDADTMKRLSLKPMAKIVSYATVGVDPSVMGIGPIGATRAALKKAGWSIADLEVIEANEAFAAQSVAVNNELGWDVSKVNVNGGSIALGHPIGASGARILTTLLYAMKQRKATKGLATLCVGGGMGLAICIEMPK